MTADADAHFRRHWWKYLLAVLLTWIPLAWFDLPLQNRSAPVGIISLELAFTPRRFDEIVATWDEVARVSAWYSLVVDLAFMVAYALALRAWARAVGQRLLAESPIVGRWGDKVGAGALLAGVCDLMENIALAVALGPGGSDPWASVASSFAALKFFLLIVALFYALNGAIAAWMAKARGLSATR